MIDEILKQIDELKREQKLLEIDYHRIDAAIWAFNETLKMLEPKSTELKVTEPAVEHGE